MVSHARVRELLRAVLAAALLASFTPSAFAGLATFCVTCKNPDQTYRCQVTGNDLKASDALKLYCVIRTAKEGNHASCSAERSTAVCNGVVKVYSYEGPVIPPEVASDPRVQRLMEQASHDQQTFAKPKGNAPKTMVELTGRAFSASRQGWRKARSALTGSSQTADQAPQESSAPLPLTPPAHAPAAPTTEKAATASVEDAPESRVGRFRQAAQTAGATVGNFARKSYRCVLSLFRHCRGEATEAEALR